MRTDSWARWQLSDRSGKPTIGLHHCENCSGAAGISAAADTLSGDREISVDGHRNIEGLGRGSQLFLRIAVGKFSDIFANLFLGAAVESIDIALVAEIEIVGIRGRAMISGCPGFPPIAVAQGNQRGEADIRPRCPKFSLPL